MNLENFAKKFGLPPWAGMLFMFGIVLMPLAQQTIGEGGDADKGQAPQ